MRAVLILTAIFAVSGAGQQPAQELRIIKQALRQFEDGPVVSAGQTFGAGETLFFSFQVQGYKVSEERRIDLHWTVDVVDSDGVKVVETAEKDLQAGLSDEDKDWAPVVRHTFMIPPIVLPGSFKLTAKVQDRIGKRDATAELTLPIRARAVEVSDTLAARNFRFVRSEENPAPVRDAAFRPGDTVWARFDIVGYKFGERNGINVEYRIGVANPDGKVLFTQPEPAVEQKESFYPQKYVPGVVSVTTQKNTPAGEYVLVLTLGDKVGNQVAEEKHSFRLQ